MTKIRIFAVIISAAFFASNLAACGSVKGSTDMSSAPPREQNQVNAKSETSSENPPEIKDLITSLPIIPKLLASEKEGLIIDLLKAMQEEYKDGKIVINTYPTPRAIGNIANGSADFLMPMLYEKNAPDSKFLYSSETLYNSIFLLYTKKGKEINPENIKSYKVEAAAGLSKFLGNLPETTAASGLQKVETDRIDGYICGLQEGTALIKKLNFKDLKAIKFKELEAKAIFPNTEKGRASEKIVSGLIASLKAKGKYQEIMKPILNQKFDEVK